MGFVVESAPSKRNAEFSSVAVTWNVLLICWVVTGVVDVARTGFVVVTAVVDAGTIAVGVLTVVDVGAADVWIVVEVVATAVMTVVGVDLVSVVVVGGRVVFSTTEMTTWRQNEDGWY